MSDVFNEYSRIMADKGLVETVKTAQKKDEKSRPRGVDLEAIEMLYGVKPNGEEDHIMEQAHPEPAIVAPSYDRFNGLVENELERQDMMQYIALKPNDGKLIHRRYISANQELLKEVIKNAFSLDIHGEEKLMKLSDSCAERLVKEADLYKEAAWGAALMKLLPYIGKGLPYIGKGALWLLGVTPMVNYFGGKIDQGVQKNAIRAENQLSDLISEYPSVQPLAMNLLEAITKIKMLNSQLSQMQIKPTEEGVALASEAKSLLNEYAQSIRDYDHELSKFKMGAEKAQKSPDQLSQFVGEYLEDAGPIIEEYVVPFFMGSDKDKTFDILQTLKESLYESLQNLHMIHSEMKQSYQNKDVGKMEQLLEGKMPDINLDELSEQFMDNG